MTTNVSFISSHDFLAPRPASGHAFYWFLVCDV